MTTPENGPNRGLQFVAGLTIVGASVVGLGAGIRAYDQAPTPEVAAAQAEPCADELQDVPVLAYGVYEECEDYDGLMPTVDISPMDGILYALPSREGFLDAVRQHAAKRRETHAFSTGGFTAAGLAGAVALVGSVVGTVRKRRANQEMQKQQYGQSRTQ